MKHTSPIQKVQKIQHTRRLYHAGKHAQRYSVAFVSGFCTCVWVFAAHFLWGSFRLMQIISSCLIWTPFHATLYFFSPTLYCGWPFSFGVIWYLNKTKRSMIHSKHAISFSKTNPGASLYYDLVSAVAEVSDKCEPQSSFLVIFPNMWQVELQLYSPLKVERVLIKALITGHPCLVLLCRCIVSAVGACWIEFERAPSFIFLVLRRCGFHSDYWMGN